MKRRYLIIKVDEKGKSERLEFDNHNDYLSAFRVIRKTHRITSEDTQSLITIEPKKSDPGPLFSSAGRKHEGTR